MDQLELAHRLETYQPSPETVELIGQTAIVLLVGISGAGKDTIKNGLLATGEYHHIVSHTTRAPRANGGVMEIDGEDYHFISHETALRMLDAGEYVEAKPYGANIYGTSVSELKKAHDDGKIAITDLEVQGVAEYKAMSKSVIALFILPPNYTEWQRRLHARYGAAGADPTDMLKRQRTAISELEAALAQSYYHFIINREVAETVTIANKIAHGHDTFNDLDVTARKQAEALLIALREQLDRR